MACAHPCGELGGVVAEDVADDGVEAADDFHAAFDEFVEGGGGGDALPARVGLDAGGRFKVCDVRVEVFEKVCGQAILDEGRLKSWRVGGGGAGCGEQLLVVGSAREVKLVADAGNVFGHGAGGAGYGLKVFVDVLAGFALGDCPLFDGAGAGRLSGGMAVDSDDDGSEFGEEGCAQSASGKESDFGCPEVGDAHEHLGNESFDVCHVDSPLEVKRRVARASLLRFEG